jgi:hypothetical protein
MDFSPAEDYLDFMKEANGAEGNVGRNAYLAIYSIQEMKTLNTGTQTLEPQLLFFGSNMGGEGYAFDLSRPGKPIVAIELDTLDRRYADDMGSSLLQFLEALDARYA